MYFLANPIDLSKPHEGVTETTEVAKPAGTLALVAPCKQTFVSPPTFIAGSDHPNRSTETTTIRVLLSDHSALHSVKGHNGCPHSF